MFCPKCGDEFVEGIKECGDCHVPLVEALCNDESEPKPSPDSESEYLELVTVFLPKDHGELMLAKSMLEDAEIRYLAKGEHVQKWGFNAVTGPVEIQVRADDAAVARELLDQLN